MAAILHKVRKGETIFSMCLEYGLTYTKFVDLNVKFLNVDVLDQHEIRPGKTVVIGDTADPVDLINMMKRKKR